MNFNINSKGDNNRINVNYIKYDFSNLKSKAILMEHLITEIESCNDEEYKNHLIHSLQLIHKKHTEEIEQKYNYINPKSTINPKSK